MANVKGRKSCGKNVTNGCKCSFQKGTHEEAFGFWLYIEENERKRGSQPDPKDEQTQHEAYKGR